MVQTIAVSELRWPIDGVRRLIDDIKTQVIVYDVASRAPSTFSVVSLPDSMPQPIKSQVVHGVHQWLDMDTGLAYIVVGPQLKVFSDFLHAIERLIERPAWRPGMPVVEDLRHCQWIPPAGAIEEWRAYVADRQRQLSGCRWAVVTRGDSSSVVSILDAAEQDAAPNGVTLRRFTSMVDAHLWVKAPATLPSR